MEKLINLLHTGGYSCTIANGGKIRTFTQRGVADLYDLLTQEPEFLKGALIDVYKRQLIPFSVALSLISSETGTSTVF